MEGTPYFVVNHPIMPAGPDSRPPSQMMIILNTDARRLQEYSIAGIDISY